MVELINTSCPDDMLIPPIGRKDEAHKVHVRVTGELTRDMAFIAIGGTHEETVEAVLSANHGVIRQHERITKKGKIKQELEVIDGLRAVDYTIRPLTKSQRSYYNQESKRREKEASERIAQERVFQAARKVMAVMDLMR